jgi:hypothetical protein
MHGMELSRNETCNLMGRVIKLSARSNFNEKENVAPSVFANQSVNSLRPVDVQINTPSIKKCLFINELLKVYNLK